MLMPPPAKGAELPEMVELDMERMPKLLMAPPRERVAVLLEMVELVTVSVPFVPL